jgi:hypothetical protein
VPVAVVVALLVMVAVLEVLQQMVVVLVAVLQQEPLERLTPAVAVEVVATQAPT